MWQLYERLSNPSQLRPYVPGEDLSGMSVNDEDTPEEGGMIARNSDSHKDQWYMGKAYFEANFDMASYGPVPD